MPNREFWKMARPAKHLPLVYRFLMASLLLLGALGLSVATARADSFQLTFIGDLSGTGTFTTDGLCTGCIIGHGLLTFTLNLGSDSGASAFDITDDSGSQNTSYNRTVNTMGYAAINSETGDGLSFSTGGAGTHTWVMGNATQSFSGTYTITPIATPEPRLFTLLLTGLLLVGFLCGSKFLASAAIS
jgi:hypothetical protein